MGEISSQIAKLKVGGDPLIFSAYGRVFRVVYYGDTAIGDNNQPVHGDESGEFVVDDLTGRGDDYANNWVGAPHKQFHVSPGTPGADGDFMQKTYQAEQIERYIMSAFSDAKFSEMRHSISSLVPIVCNACGGSFRTASLIDLKCGCGSDDVDLDPREAALIEATEHIADGAADRWNAELDQVNQKLQDLGAVRTLDDGAEVIDESKAPADLIGYYRRLIQTGYAMGFAASRRMAYPYDLPYDIDDPKYYNNGTTNQGLRPENPDLYVNPDGSICPGGEACRGECRKVTTSSLHTAAVGDGPGYYVLSGNQAVAGPFATVALARDNMPIARGNAVQYLTSSKAIEGLAGTDSFQNPSGFSAFGDEPLGAFGGGSAKPLGGMPAAFGAKLREITSGLLTTNPGMPEAEAQRLAARTIERFPGIVSERKVTRY